MVRPLDVPGVHAVPEAMDIDTLHSPPATHILYELPSVAQS